MKPVITELHPGALFELVAREVDPAEDPQPGRVSHTADGGCLLWLGPDSRLFNSGRRPSPDQAGVEVTDGWRVFRVEHGASDWLAQGCALDFARMPPDGVALTRFHDCRVLLHRLAADRFELYVERSYSESLLAGTGIEIHNPGGGTP